MAVLWIALVREKAGVKTTSPLSPLLDEGHSLR
jgi:hypothetical protein